MGAEGDAKKVGAAAAEKEGRGSFTLEHAFLTGLPAALRRLARDSRGPFPEWTQGEGDSGSDPEKR